MCGSLGDSAVSMLPRTGKRELIADEVDDNACRSLFPSNLCSGGTASKVASKTEQE